VNELRHQDAPGRQLLRLRRLRQHQRLQLMGIVKRGPLAPMVGDPDDHRPRTTWRLAVDPGTGGRTAGLSFLEERCAVGDRVPLHGHDVDEVVIVLAGEDTYSLGGKDQEVSSGDVVFIPAGPNRFT